MKGNHIYKKLHCMKKLSSFYIFLFIYLYVGCDRDRYYFKDIDITEVGVLVNKSTNEITSSELLTGGTFKIKADNDLIIYDLMEQRGELDFRCLTIKNQEVEVQVIFSFFLVKDSVINIHRKYGPRYYNYFVVPEIKNLVRSEMLIRESDFNDSVDTLRYKVGDFFLKEGFLFNSLLIQKMP
jgi:hypothetical protein